jgi:hypothetical protein
LARRFGSVDALVVVAVVVFVVNIDSIFFIGVVVVFVDGVVVAAASCQVNATLHE